MVFGLVYMNKAFTLVETLVVIVIIVILSLIILPNYYSAKQQLALQRSAFKLAQDIRIVQEMAISTEELDDGTFPSGGYGVYIYFDEDDPTPQNSYILFADMNNNQRYGAGTDLQIGETKFLESKVRIKSLNKLQTNIVFMPPDPQVFLSGKNPEDAAWENFDPITIVLCLEEDETKEITLRVHGTGLVDID